MKISDPASRAAGKLPSPCRFLMAIALAAWPGWSVAALTAEEMAALASPPTSAHQEHGDAAFKLAHRLGTERRLDGLEAIVAMQAPRLVDLWRDGFGSSAIANERGQDSPREVAVVEAAVLAHLAKVNPESRMADALAQVFSNIRWRSRPTYDLLKTRAIGPTWPPDVRFTPLFNTGNPDLGGALFALRDAVPAPMRQGFLATLSRLKVTAAVPFIEETLNTRQPGELLVGDLARSLSVLDDRNPPPALVARIKRDLEQSSWSSAQQDAAMLLGVIADGKTGRPLDYQTLRASLGNPVPEQLREGLVRTIESQRAVEGREDLVSIVAGGGNPAAYAASVVARIPDEDLWKRTLDAARAAKLREPGNQRLDYPITQLEKNVAKGPAGAQAMKRELDRQEATTRMSLAEQRVDRLLTGNDVSAEAGEQLEASLGQYRKRIDELGPNGRIFEETFLERRLSVALWFRFRQGDPRRALAAFNRLADEGMLEGAVAAADTLQHEFGDPKGAAARLESILAKRRLEKAVVWSGGNMSVGENWVRQWLEAELAYLKSGKRFVGPVTLESSQAAGAAGFILSLRMPWRLMQIYAIESTQGKRLLDELRESRPTRYALPALQAALAHGGSSELSAEFLRNDPTGFLSAQFVGYLVAYSDPGRETRAKSVEPEQLAVLRRGWKETAVDLARSTGVRFSLEPDPTYATPEKTWGAFLAALRKADRSAAGACFTPGALGKWGPILGELSAADLKEMADSVRGFAPSMMLDQHAEYFVARVGGEGGIVSFARHFGEWKISQM